MRRREMEIGRWSDEREQKKECGVCGVWDLSVLAVPYHCAGLGVLTGAAGKRWRFRAGHRLRVALLDVPKETIGEKREKHANTDRGRENKTADMRDEENKEGSARENQQTDTE